MSDEEAPDLQCRRAREIARRCLALLVVIERAYSRPDEPLHEAVQRAIPHADLSSAERGFLANIDPPTELRNSLSWRAEAVVSLLWALGHIDSVYPLNQRVDLASIPAAHAAFQDPATFVSQAVARTPDLLDATEGDVYHEHWRVRDAQLFGRPMPPELDPDIVYERRYALSWVVGFGEDWDDVPTDT